jgi:hypothetical protein
MPKLMGAVGWCLDPGMGKIIPNHGGDGYCTEKAPNWGAAS